VQEGGKVDSMTMDGEVYRRTGRAPQAIDPYSKRVLLIIPGSRN